jgi:hypothetical protein
MDDHSFSTTFTVDQTPEEAFAAINDVRGWWSGEIDGSTDTLGASSRNATEIRFTHVGLVPDHECFGACSKAWGALTTRSLRARIARGSAPLRAAQPMA